MHERNEGAGTPHRRRGYAWGLLALLTCPCHLPVVALLLSGTAAGAFIGAHIGVATLAAVALFGVSVAFTIRAFKAPR